MEVTFSQMVDCGENKNKSIIHDIRHFSQMACKCFELKSGHPNSSPGLEHTQKYKYSITIRDQGGLQKTLDHGQKPATHPS